MDELTVKYVSLDECLPNDWNPNEQSEFMQDKTIASIISDGFVDPITVRSVGGFYEIIDGYHRWLALSWLRDHPDDVVERLGEIENDIFYHNEELHALLDKNQVPVIDMGDISREQAMRLTVNLNNVRGESNQVKLVKVLKDLREKSSLQDVVARLPYKDNQLKGIIESLKHGDVTKDKPPPVSDDPIAEVGDRWMLGNCSEVAAIEMIPEGCDAIVKRYIKHMNTAENVFVMRDGKQLNWYDVSEGRR